MKRTVATVVVVLGVTGLCGTDHGRPVKIASAEERHDYVFVAEAAVAAFQCAVFAAHADYDSEEKRLFSYGREQARLFIQAARNGRVPREQIFGHKNPDWALALRVWNFQPQDSSTDFVAGRVYESIWESTTENLGNKSRGAPTYQGPPVQNFPAAIAHWQRTGEPRNGSKGESTSLLRHAGAGSAS